MSTVSDTTNKRVIRSHHPSFDKVGLQHTNMRWFMPCECVSYSTYLAIRILLRLQNQSPPNKLIVCFTPCGLFKHNYTGLYYFVNNTGLGRFFPPELQKGEKKLKARDSRPFRRVRRSLGGMMWCAVLGALFIRQYVSTSLYSQYSRVHKKQTLRGTAGKISFMNKV